jgi:hypothetical protein
MSQTLDFISAREAGLHMVNFVALETNTISGINGTQISILPLINR